MRPLVEDTEFATDDTFSSGPDTGQNTKVTPSAGQRGQGMVPGTGAPAPIFNRIMHDNGKLTKYYRDIDWLNWSYPRVTEFSNDSLTGVLNALAYRPGLSIESEAAGDGAAWMGATSLTPWGVVSADGQKWENNTMEATGNGAVAHPKSVYYCDFLSAWIVGAPASAGGVNDEILSSTDGGTTWLNNGASDDDDFRGMVDNGSALVMCRGANGFAVVTAGFTVNKRTHPASNKSMYDVAWNGSIFCAVGNAGTVVTSPDGTTWTDRTAGSTTVNNLRSIAWDAVAGVFVAVGSSNTIISSADGISWTDRSEGISGDFNCIVADGSGTFFATGNRTAGGGVIGRSLDGGATWEFQHQRVIDNLKGCVIGGGRLAIFGSAPENLGSNVIAVGLSMRTSLDG